MDDFPDRVDSANKQLATLSIDQRTGKILWRRTVGPETIEKVHEISSPAGSTPVTDGERLYVYFGSYGLIAYDRDGNKLWEKRLPNPENPYGAVASPIVAGDLLILNHQGKDAYLLGLNRRDGRTVWKTDRSMLQYGWSTPVHWRHDGVDEILVLGGDFKPNQRLMAYNLADGSERWWKGTAAVRKEHTSHRRRVTIISPRRTSSWTHRLTKKPRPGGPDLRQQRLSRHSRSSGRQRRSQPNTYRLVGDQGCARRFLAALL